METSQMEGLRDIESLFSSRFSDDPRIRKELSSDFSWLSPILSKEIGSCVADAVVWPKEVSELVGLLDIARKCKIPIIPRGGGTSNYGQVVPIKGGVMVDMTKMNRILKISEDDLCVDVEAGTNIKVLMQSLQNRGFSLKIFPTTYASSTIGGFYCGGSRGFGSTKYGTIWDGNLLSADVLNADGVEKRYTERELDGIIHAYGTTGIVVRLRVPIVKKTEEIGYILSIPTLHDALRICKDLISASSTIKLLSIIEPEIARRYNSILKGNVFDEEKYNIIVMFEAVESRSINQILGKYHLAKIEEAADKLKDHIVEFSFNHVALWGKKSNPNLTNVYMHFYDLDRVEEAVADIKRQFGEDILFHLEFTKQLGKMIVTSLSLLNYKGYDFYLKFTDYVASKGILIMNIHSYLLNNQIGHLSKERLSIIQKLKRINDPYNILNPGKIIL